MFIAFIISTIFAAVLSQCPNNGIIWQSECYSFQSSLVGFANAEQSCTQYGGNLASIHNSFTNTFVAQQASLFFNSNASQDFWIGGTTMIKPQSWSWTDGSNFDFDELWDHRMGNSSYCIGMRMSDGVWNIQDCYQSKSFVCKFPATPKPCNAN